MENNSFIIEDIYEPIKFGMKNSKGEIFECQSRFRSTEENIKIEKLMQPAIPHYDKDDNLINEKEVNETKSERVIKAMILFAGKDFNFWSQFSDNALSQTISKISEMENEKYKKKPGKK